MPCYGLLINNLGKYVYITADTQYSPQKLLTSYEMATLIFHDCETAKHKTGVHAHYSELNQLELHLKKKMWLYHYNPGALPDAEADGFLGFIKKGQSFLI